MNFFEAQSRALRSTRWLVAAYVVATVLIVAGVTLVVAVAFRLFGDVGGSPNPSLLLATALLSALLIVGATIFKTATLSAGGSRVATDMGGTLIPPDIRDPLRRRLRNVVEEMAIASGVVAPEVYVLEAEPGINAFAAGLAPGDAAIAVTRGALEILDRDELQGVIAHEFSHILNGDMRLNVHMIGVLFGIMVLSIIGRTILRGSHYGRGVSLRRNRGAPLVLAIGGGLAILGWLGVLLARIIKASVSRQRELLADASAVQFTRQTEGLANALKKIGGYESHSWFRATDPEEVSHMLFARGRRLSMLFATHPPLATRIRALDPSFREDDYPHVGQPSQQVPDEAAAQAAASALASDARTTVDRNALLDTVANPGPVHIAFARRLHGSIPPQLYDAAHSQEDSWLLTLALVLHVEPAHRDRQLGLLAEQIGRDRAERVRQFDTNLRELGAEYHLPLLDIAFPALRRRPATQLRFLLDLIRRLVELDERIDLREYCFMRILTAGLELVMPMPGSGRAARMKASDTRQAVLLLLRTAARHGGGNDEARQRAYGAGFESLGVAPGAYDDGPDSRQPSVSELDRSLDLLRRLKPGDKRRVVKALTATLLSDRILLPREVALLRAICAALDCPLPPILTAGESAERSALLQT